MIQTKRKEGTVNVKIVASFFDILFDQIYGIKDYNKHCKFDDAPDSIYGHTT